MSKRDYEEIAATVRWYRDHADSPEVAAVIDALADSLSEDFTRLAPNFNADRFLIACGVKP